MPVASPHALSHVSPTVGIRDQLGNIVNLSTDAFGRVRVSNPHSLVGVKQVDLTPSPVMTSTALDAGSTWAYQLARSSSYLTATVDGEKGCFQTARHPAYEQGKGQWVLCTGRLGKGTKSLTTETAFTRMGQFDGEQGAYWEVSSADNEWRNYIVLRSGLIGTTRVAQNDSALDRWNIDTLDGSLRPTNPSGIRLDPSSCAILALSYEWLGVGGVLASFVVNNLIIPAHFFPHANLQSSVYMRTPNLPVRWEVELDGAALPQAELEAICASVISEGGAEYAGLPRADRSAAAVAVADGETRELLSIRLRCAGATDGESAITSATVFPELFHVVNASNNRGIIQLGYNASFGSAGAWADPIGNQGSYSHVQVCKSERLITDPGHVFHIQNFSVDARQGSASFDKTIALGMRARLDAGYGVADTITLMEVNETGTPITASADLNWREVV